MIGPNSSACDGGHRARGGGVRRHRERHHSGQRRQGYCAVRRHRDRPWQRQRRGPFRGHRARRSVLITLSRSRAERVLRGGDRAVRWHGDGMRSPPAAPVETVSAGLGAQISCDAIGAAAATAPASAQRSGVAASRRCSLGGCKRRRRGGGRRHRRDRVGMPLEEGSASSLRPIYRGRPGR